LSVRDGVSLPAFDALQGVEIHTFSGPHPSGNTSVHIQNISPLNKGEVIWTLTAQDVCSIGSLFLTGECRLDRVISVSGEGVNTPKHVSVLPGAAASSILANDFKGESFRIISGNVLTGKHIGLNDGLHFYHHQVATLPEGDQPDFLGWLLPGFDKFSLSRTFFSWLSPNKTFALNTNMHGEQRNFVMTGQYDRVFPFDIYPVQLLKAMWAGDIDKMEQLGIYEIVEEDFALCEVICTSKQPLQELVREALDTVYTEMN
jgi:Na+-transporting NADH:ubiquinone oxidoreductase subunit A